MAIVVLYAASIHQAAASGDLERMKATVQQAEEWLKEAGAESRWY